MKRRKQYGHKKRKAKMSKEAQSPIVKIGTKLTQGVVIGILYGKIEILGENGVSFLPFTTVENEVLSNG